MYATQLVIHYGSCSSAVNAICEGVALSTGKRGIYMHVVYYIIIYYYNIILLHDMLEARKAVRTEL